MLEDLDRPIGVSLELADQDIDLVVEGPTTLNPHLIRGVTPPNTSYGVRVPPGRAPMVVASLGRKWGLADD